MEWQVIQTQDDANDFLERMEMFHDWFVAEASMFVDGGRCWKSADDRDRSAVTVKFTYDSPMPVIGFPSVEMKFEELSQFEILPEVIAPLMEATLENTTHGWIFCNDGPLSDSELEHPEDIRASLFIYCGNVSWRGLE